MTCGEDMICEHYLIFTIESLHFMVLWFFKREMLSVHVTWLKAIFEEPDIAYIYIYIYIYINLEQAHFKVIIRQPNRMIPEVTLEHITVTS